MVAPRIVAFGLLGLSAVFMICWITITIHNDEVGFSTYELPYPAIFKALQDNLRSPPIVDVKVMTTACDAGYKQQVLGFWPGTLEACICTSKVGTETKYTTLPRSCKASDKDCRSTARVPPQTLKSWADSNILCVKQADYAYTNGGNCPNGYDKCSNQVCVKTDSPCPITNLITQNKAPAVPEGQQAPPASFSYGTESVQQRWIIAERAEKNKQSNSQFLNGFIADLGTPCVNPFYKPRRGEQTTSFHAEPLQYLGCQNQNDLSKSYMKSIFTSAPEIDVLEDNGISDYLGAYEAYLNAQKSDLNIYNRIQVKVNDVECYNNWDLDTGARELSENNHSLFKLMDLYHVWLIYLASFAFIAAVASVGLPQRPLLLLAGILIAAVCILEIIQFIHYVNKNDITEGPYGVVSRNCLTNESPYTEYVNQFREINEWQYKHYDRRAYAMFFLAIFVLIIDIILLLLSGKAGSGDAIDASYGIAQEDKQEYDDNYQRGGGYKNAY